MWSLTEEQIDKICTMTAPVFVAGDMHLKRRTWTNWPELSGDAYQVIEYMEQLRNFTLNKGKPISDIILCGDTFDSNMVSSADIYKFSQLTKVPVRYIRGNHDSIQPSYIEAVTNTFELSAELTPIADGAAYICGLPYIASRSELLTALENISTQIKLQDIKEPIYIVMHQAFEHMIPIEGAFQLSSSDVEALFDRKVYILVGHIHKLDCRPLSGALSGGYILSTSSPYPTAWENIPQFHGIHILDLASGEYVSVNFHIRDYITLEPSEAVYLIDMLQRISDCFIEGCLPTAVRITVPENMTVDAAKTLVAQHPNILARLGRSTSESAPVNHSSRPDSTTYSILDAVKEDLQNSGRAQWDQLFLLATNIIEADDPADYLGKLISSWIAEETTDDSTDENNA